MVGTVTSVRSPSELASSNRTKNDSVCRRFGIPPSNTVDPSEFLGIFFLQYIFLT